jgi:(1->4)-alpha-D-glucan 1-alpha-D-glucosylmutase
LSFVDPDNRRPVDFAKRAAILGEFKRREREDRPSLIGELIADWRDARIKLYTVYKSLNFRRAESALFRSGDYLPVEAAGKMKENVCAFARRFDGSWALAAAPRLVTRITPAGAAPLGESVWGRSALDLPAEAPDRWRNVFTEEEIEAAQSDGKKTLNLAAIFKTFPVAFLAANAPR